MEQTRTFRGRFERGAPDWHYVPVEVPEGVREMAVHYRFDDRASGNRLDIGIFDPNGHGLGEPGFRGWSGGSRESLVISASGATPGYLPGPIHSGVWRILLGPYAVASRGMNWTVEVTLRFGTTGRAFQPDPAPETVENAGPRGPRWFRGDPHLHTIHSDGLRTPEELAAAARSAGLDFIVSTEHNTPSASLQWGRHAGPDLLVIDGEEITTRDGHWIAAGLRAGQWIDWRYRARDGELARFVSDVRRVGGVAVAAHPYCPFAGCDWRFGLEDMDAVEVWNGTWTPDDEAALSLWDRELRNGRRRLAAIGGSDAHREPEVVGLPQTVVWAADLTRSAVLDGVATGRGFLAESRDVTALLQAWAPGRRTVGPGETLSTDSEVIVSFRVAGTPGCVTKLLTEDGPVCVATIDSTGETELIWRTRSGDSAYVRAEVRRPEPTSTTPDTMVALTNPVWLE